MQSPAMRHDGELDRNQRTLYNLFSQSSGLREAFSGGRTLANIKSAEKRWRQNIKRRARNRMVRSATRTYVKDARLAIEDGDVQESAEAVREAISALDRAVSKGVIHRNNAARRKSRLMQRMNKVAQGPEQA